MKTKTPRKRMAGLRNYQSGMMMMELMMGMVVLAIGLGAVTSLFVVAVASNNRSNRATTATMLSQLVLDTISAQPANAPAPIVLSDCAGNQWQIATTGGAAPGGTGAILVTSSTSQFYGGIDPTQSYAAIPPATSAVPGYAMYYVDCGPNGQQSTYDVRWNVVIMDTNTRLITVSSRQLSDPTRLGGQLYSLPVTLRGIGGS